MPKMTITLETDTPGELLLIAGQLFFPVHSTETSAKLEQALSILKQLGEFMPTMQQELDRLRKSVEQSNTIAESGTKLIEGIAAKLREIADDPAEVTAFADSLDAANTKLSAAIEANTGLLTGANTGGSGGTGTVTTEPLPPNPVETVDASPVESDVVPQPKRP